MHRRLLKLAALGILVVPLFSVAPAQAQAVRTWVSGTGNDANPCSRTSPCLTFAGALAVTASGGEINCLDPGGYGAVTIAQPVTIDCSETLGSILVSAANAININAPGGSVILRGLEFAGVGTGVNGINITAASLVMIEKSRIWGFTGNGVNVSVSALAQVFLSDVTITQVSKAVSLTASGGAAIAYLNNVRAFGYTTSGVEASTTGIAIITDSVIVGSTGGTGIITSAGSGSIAIANSLIAANSTGLRVGAAGSKIQMTGLKFFFNNASTSIAAGGTLASGGDNKLDQAGATPNATITNQ